MNYVIYQKKLEAPNAAFVRVMHEKLTKIEYFKKFISNDNLSTQHLIID